MYVFSGIISYYLTPRKVKWCFQYSHADKHVLHDTWYFSWLLFKAFDFFSFLLTYTEQNENPSKKTCDALSTYVWTVGMFIFLTVPTFRFNRFEDYLNNYLWGIKTRAYRFRFVIEAVQTSSPLRLIRYDARWASILGLTSTLGRRLVHLWCR